MYERKRNKHVKHIYNAITEAVEKYQALHPELWFDTGALNEFLQDEFDVTHGQLPLLMESCENLEEYAVFLREEIGRSCHISFTKEVGADNQVRPTFLLHIDVTPQARWTRWTLLQMLQKNWPPIFFGILLFYFILSHSVNF